MESHGALTWAPDLMSAYHKMESVEFYAELLYKSKMLGGPKEFDKDQIEKLYEIRRKMGLPGKHPANLCPNAKAGKESCHSCGGSCSGSCGSGVDKELVSSITKKVMEQLGL